MLSVLAIGGSDSSSGAGIQADLKTFSMLGLHCATVITCITAQSTETIKKIYPLPVEAIAEQFDTVIKDMDIQYVKTGMLHSAEIVKLVAEKISKYNLKAVVDPVMKSTTNIKLVEQNFINSLRKYLIPETFILMPNLYEASTIIGKEVKNICDMELACKELYKSGAKYIIIKGGHLEKEAVDILYDGKNFKRYSSPKLIAKAHGSGCSYSALITGLIAKDLKIENAIENAKNLITKMILASYKPGKGVDVVSQYAIVEDDVEKYRVLKELKEGVEWVKENLPLQLAPEVGINFVYALPNATSLQDVCGIEGRMVKVGNRLKRVGKIEFGKSKHIATAVLTAMRYDKSIRSAMNIKYSEEILERARASRLKISSFDRSKEPQEEKISTMEWGTSSAIKKAGFVPDIIYDKGALGKEAMIRILGKSPKDVTLKLLKLSR
ncbi:MAG: bifunctional hydroxymethylpyrimidine kinase/phosphomethylpyrimidine kinase [Candidatus Thermoplasmatota archaeon]|nr:bifunctional hydroxymethylpyrimidine kinase/phosphomethylpyrimidine kinase [Candidatus Thermoplasmatota archaeon]